MFESSDPRYPTHPDPSITCSEITFVTVYRPCVVNGSDDSEEWDVTSDSNEESSDNEVSTDDGGVVSVGDTFVYSDEEKGDVTMTRSG